MHNGEVQGTFVVPIGPQHPALKEPGHFEFTVDGETVTGASVRLGYAHRGIEKACESRNWVQDLYLLERVCGICSHSHALGFALGVEKLAGVVAPPRAQAIRVLVAELERVHSHLLWLGVAAHEAGFDTLFMYAWRDREAVMDALEALTGNRVNYSANLLGGVKFDVSPAQSDAIRSALDALETRTVHYRAVVTGDESFLQRTRGLAVFGRAEAERLGVVGPTARASGVPHDVRIDDPYAGYSAYQVDVPTSTTGDLAARFAMRIEELFASYRLARQVLDTLPPGELTARMPRRIKEGETISRIEAPRGELFYFIRSNGSDTPERVKLRTPTMSNLASVPALTMGRQLADVPMILVGVDPCFSCNDRTVTMRRAGDGRTMSWEELTVLAARHYGQAGAA